MRHWEIMETVAFREMFSPQGWGETQASVTFFFPLALA